MGLGKIMRPFAPTPVGMSGLILCGKQALGRIVSRKNLVR